MWYSIIREKLVIYFISPEILPFFRSLCFQQPPKCYRKDPITSTLIVKTPVGPLQIVSWGLSLSILREKSPKNFCHREDSLFMKSLVLDFLGPRKTIILLAQDSSKYLVCPYKFFSDVCRVRYYERRKAKTFFSLESLPFSSKNCVFNNLLGPKNMLF